MTKVREKDSLALTALSHMLTHLSQHQTTH